MAFLSTQNENRDYLSGKTDTPGETILFSQAPAPDLGGAGIAPTAVTETAGTGLTAPGGNAGAASDLYDDTNQNSNNTYLQQPPLRGAPSQPPNSGSTLQGRLFSPIDSGLQTGGQGLGTAVQQFYDAAGPSRRFRDIDAQNTLMSAVQGGGDIGAARNLVGAQYGGPSQLSYDLPLDLSARARAISGTGANLQSYIQAENPNMTSGASLFEAQKLYGNKGFQEKRKQYQPEIDKLFTKIAEEKAKASQFAGTRQAQEQNIAQRSTDFVRDIQDKTFADIDVNVERAFDQRDRNTEIIERMRDPDYQATEQDLEELGLDLQLLRGSKKRQQGEERKQDIFDRFPDIADISAAQLSVDASGREQLKFEYDGETYEIHDALTGRIANLPEGVSREQFSDIADQVSRRQRILERNFGSGSQEHGHRWVRSPGEGPGSFNISDAGLTSSDGAWAGYDNLYFGEESREGAEPFPDYRTFLEEDIGTLPTRANIASGEQRRKVNNASRVLDSAIRLERTDPHQAATLRADVGGFLAREVDAAASQARNADRATQDWVREVNELHHSWLDSQGSWGDFANPFTYSRIMLNNPATAFREGTEFSDRQTGAIGGSLQANEGDLIGYVPPSQGIRGEGPRDSRGNLLITEGDEDLRDARGIPLSNRPIDEDLRDARGIPLNPLWRRPIDEEDEEDEE